MKRRRCLGVATLLVALFPAAALAQEAAAVPGEPPVRLSLEEALGRALERSEEVRAAQAQVEVAAAGTKSARSAALPQVHTQLAYTRTLRSIYQGGGLTLPDSLRFEPNPDAPLEERVRYLEDNVPNAGLGALGGLFSNLPFGREHAWVGSLSVTQPLFAGGQIRAGIEAAGAAEDAARAMLEEKRGEVALAVKEAYYGAALAARSVEIVESSVALAREHLEQVRLRQQAGRASELEVMRAEVEASNLEPQLVQATNARDLALLDLKRLINLPVEAAVALTTAIEPEGEEGPRLAALELPDLAQATERLQRRAALRAAESQVEARRKQVDRARGAYLPTVALTGNLSRQAFPSGMLPGSGDWRDDWSVGVAMQWSPFQGFRRKAEVEAATAEVRQAELQRDQLEEGVRLEYERARGELERAQRQVSAAARTVAQAERVYRLTEMRFREGIATQLDVSNARLALQQARLNQVQAYHDAYLAVARAERALGLPADRTISPAR